MGKIQRGWLMNHSTLTTFNSRIVAINPLAGNLVELLLERPTDFNWQAGDYLWLGLDENQLKPFSIANLSDGNTNHIQCDIAVTEALAEWWKKLTQATSCLIKGPVNQYHWPEGDAPIYLLAGGTGITPLLALLKAHETELTDRVVTLYWGVRRSELLFARELLDHLAKTYAKFHWQAIISDEHDDWTGAKGNLPDAVMQSINDVSHYQWLICGPWPMVQILKNWLVNQLVDVKKIQ
jgi:CDP-4-dehydro-6-deoxyglucose reductase